MLVLRATEHGIPGIMEGGLQHQVLTDEYVHYDGGDPLFSYEEQLGLLSRWVLGGVNTQCLEVLDGPDRSSTEPRHAQ